MVKVFILTMQRMCYKDAFVLKQEKRKKFSLSKVITGSVKARPFVCRTKKEQICVRSQITENAFL